MKPTALPQARTTLAAALDDLAPLLDNPQDVATAKAHARAARLASLWWVTPEMTSLALDASRSLPDWTPTLAAPDDIGILVWDGDLPPVPYDGARRSVWPVGPLGVPAPPQAPVRGVLWRTVGDRIEMSALINPRDFPAEVWQIPVGDLVQSTGVLLSRVARSIPLIDPDGALRTGVDRSWLDSLIALVGATWLLMLESMVTDRRTLPVRAPRRSRPAPGQAWTPVTTITLRPAVRPPSEPDPDHTPKWSLTRRHLVRGHWRQQAVGAGRARREPRWVHAHLRGPAGAPISTAEHVYVWRR